MSPFWIGVTFGFCVLSPFVESQVRVFPLIPLDGSPFAGRPQRNNLANVLALNNGSNSSSDASTVAETPTQPNSTNVTESTSAPTTTAAVLNGTEIQNTTTAQPPIFIAAIEPNHSERPAHLDAVPLKGAYVNTSALSKPCAHHYDCYGLREPDEWCPLGEAERYLEKGCFCDYTRDLCTIQRLSESGAQYSDCAEKSTSACAGLGNSINKARQHLQRRK